MLVARVARGQHNNKTSRTRLSAPMRWSTRLPQPEKANCGVDKQAGGDTQSHASRHHDVGANDFQNALDQVDVRIAYLHQGRKQLRLGVPKHAAYRDTKDEERRSKSKVGDEEVYGGFRGHGWRVKSNSFHLGRTTITDGNL
jgi:hypothetical protein